MEKKRKPYHAHVFKNGVCVKCPMIESDYIEWKALAKEALTELSGLLLSKINKHDPIYPKEPIGIMNQNKQTEKRLRN